METLFVHSLLWKCGFESEKEYEIILDKLFLENPKADILLELEGCVSNCDVTYEKNSHFWNYKYDNLDVRLFGKEFRPPLYQMKDIGTKNYKREIGMMIL